MSLNRIKVSLSKHGLSSRSSKPADAPATPHAPASRSAQATPAAVHSFGKGPATVYAAAYKPSAQEADAHYGGICAIYLQNETGQDILQRISRSPSGQWVLEAPKYNTVPPKSELRFPPVKVGTIPKGYLTEARNILRMQKPDDGKVGEKYNSKDWVKLVLDWFADDACFRWEVNAQMKVKAMPQG